MRKNQGVAKTSGFLFFDPTKTRLLVLTILCAFFFSFVHVRARPPCKRSKRQMEDAAGRKNETTAGKINITIFFFVSWLLMSSKPRGENANKKKNKRSILPFEEALLLFPTQRLTLGTLCVI